MLLLIITLTHQLAFSQDTYPKKEIRGADTVCVSLISQIKEINDQLVVLDRCEELREDQSKTIETLKTLNIKNDAIIGEKNIQLIAKDTIIANTNKIIVLKNKEIEIKDKEIIFQKTQKKVFLGTSIGGAVIIILSILIPH
jgi:nicotinic acid mononucleotide adenylyltransferase